MAPQVDHVITGVSSIAGAGPGCLVFAEEEASFAAALASGAGAVLVGPQMTAVGASKPVLRIPQPRLAFARAALLLRDPQPAPSIHPTAVIAPGVQIGDRVSVGAHASVEEGASIGAGTIIGSGAVIGAGVRIGSNCHIYPRVVIYPGATLGDRVVVHAGAVLGADGFGYVRDRTNGEYTQFPQQGTLVIEDDVEIGANTTIDRGALEETRIGRGTKLDNLIHIGHNCNIGRNVVIAAQTGISGSSAVGDGAILGGQVGMGDHAMVGPGVILGGQAGILPKKKLLGPGIVFWGTPAKPVRQYLKELAMLARLKRPAGKRIERVMAIVVVGGHSRSVGKTSVVASLIARLPERHWTACKITQFGHGFCTANGEPCDCQTDEHTIAITAERDPNTGTDSARFLAAGASRSLWVRTRIGRLADAMPRIRQEIDAAENIIFESNSLLQFLRPDLYLTVLDHATADFKDSARLFLDRADAVLLRASGQHLTPQWKQVSLRLMAGKPRFLVTPPRPDRGRSGCFRGAKAAGTKSGSRSK